ncbi:MAG: cytochrome bc complex cytochrome b subunit [Bacteroidota bacterium]|nr:cytochrome bc complex cytochrome b subunit [Bacteroidota bacterium]MDP4234613.1 cytochrome bc complex cytochrome b subunit [Bacteroidota bacterium]MDP4243788.1 cytochrome bc complex cytochrome b subunit [Bacteroidota bacterium]MDP4288974.1 cytochrome bc complex cytochrome b subunit [Bacteroidota bacterium]
MTLIDHLHLREPYEALKAKHVPRHKSSMWYYMGGLAFFLFCIQIATGMLLLFYYQPTPEAAHQSLELLITKVPFGSVLRSLHSWSANALISVVFLHMFSTFFMRSYRSPRQILWLTGILLLLLMLGFGFTGYLLPWDSTAYFATRIGTEIPKTVPIFGDAISGLLRGSKNVTGATLTRLFGLHVAVLPLIAVILVGAHVTMTALFGSSLPPGIEAKAKTRFIPQYVLGESILWLIGLAILLCLAVLYPWNLGPAYDLTKPTEPPAGVHPEWYFMFLFQSLKYVPEWLAVLLYTLVLIFWTLVPWLDRKNGRHGRASIFTWLGITAILGMITLTTLAYISVEAEIAKPEQTVASP